MMCLVFGICGYLSGNPVVIDGDTIRIKQQSIRLWGIDAPELDEPGGLDAKYMLETIISYNKVTCKPVGARSHKRIVATCVLPSGENIAATLVQRGFALDCTRYSRGKYKHLEPTGIRSVITSKPYC
jgi:micrococcal nuclease